MEKQNPYEVLGITEDASPETVKKAYRRLAAQLHPDRNPNNASAEERFKSINAAYDILKDSNRRQQYDRSRHQPFNFHQPQQADFSFEDVINDFIRTHDIFRRGQAAPPQRNRDISVVYTISLEEAFTGKETDIHYIVPNKGRCTTHIHVPAGVDSGVKIRHAGLGDDQHDHLPPGDLYVVIQVKSHSRFERSGNDLVSRMVVDALDAMADEDITIPSIDGRSLSVRLPLGVQSGQIIRVSGEGMPDMRNGDRGDLYMHIGIKIPDNLTDEEKHILRQMREGMFAIHE